MKDLKKALKKIVSNLNKTATEIESIAGQLDVSAKVAPSKQVTSARTRKKATSQDVILGIIRRSRKGVNTAKLKEKTGFNARKIQNTIYKLKKDGKIKSEQRGVFIQA